MGKTTALRQEITRVFIPRAQKAGFDLDRKNSPVFIEFRRIDGDIVHLFDIQWEKYGRPRFVVNFGTCPAAGMETGGKHYPPSEVSAGWTPVRGRLQPGRGSTTSNWFCQDRPLWRRLFGKNLRSPAEVVSLLIKLFEELETFWKTGAVGPHLRIYPS
ncbi:MAG: DUF4304 domain-containing protein [Candidatus Omnitrophota bacterium]